MQKGSRRTPLLRRRSQRTSTEKSRRQIGSLQRMRMPRRESVVCHTACFLHCRRLRLHRLRMREYEKKATPKKEPAQGKIRIDELTSGVVKINATALQASEKATKAKDAGVQKKKATPKKMPAEGKSEEKKPAAKKSPAKKPAAKKETKASPKKKQQGAKAASKKGAAKK